MIELGRMRQSVSATSEAWESTMAGETANTFKFGTFLWFIAGLLIPLWPISLPVCWFMAYKSYKSGDAPAGNISDLQSAVELHKQGIISDAELEKIKSRTIK